MWPLDFVFLPELGTVEDFFVFFPTETFGVYPMYKLTLSDRVFSDVHYVEYFEFCLYYNILSREGYCTPSSLLVQDS